MSPDTSAAEAALQAKLSRKRTKTGCLTCRKRRIKCGEEKPICRNCVKSKRICEGYSQRPVFRQPTYDYRTVPHGGAHITFQIGPQPGPAMPYTIRHQHPSNATFPTPIQPHYVGHHQPAFYPPHPQYVESRDIPPPSHPRHPPNVGIPIYPTPHAPPFDYSALQHLPYTDLQPMFDQNVIQTPTSIYTDPTHHAAAALYPSPPSQSRSDQTWGREAPAQISNGHRTSPISNHSSRTLDSNGSPVQSRRSPTRSSDSYIPRPELLRPIDYQTPPPAVQESVYTSEASQEYYHETHTTVPSRLSHAHISPAIIDFQQDPQFAHSTTISDFLAAAAIEIQDDDYYDVEPDEEMELDALTITSQHDQRHHALVQMIHRRATSPRDLQTRGYDTYIYDGILDHYRVDEVANPLKNMATARLFMHFVAVTGPILSTFERHPHNASVVFHQSDVPLSQQGLWTYTMPMAALKNQGLLHCMLALASFHIAKIQKASVTPSIQHYAWALKRVHHSVGHPKKRLKHTTIAASLLLGYYEIMAAEHMKWNTHLAGSKQLFTETDFVGMTQQFRQMKRDRAARQRSGMHSPATQRSDEILDQIPDIDEDFVSQLVGKQISYENHGRVMSYPHTIPPTLDLSKFEILKDLWWWYCKQDAYQSIVSGNALLLDYSRWPSCPPRAPIGDKDAVLGSFDHLILLLGRIADFSYRDRSRKLLQMEANGGQWRPAPGMKMPARPPQPTPPSSTNPAPPPQPLFYGMAPSSAAAPMPSSYNPIHGIPTPQTASPKDPLDLSAATSSALEEYGRIRAALHTFSQSLPPTFHPLTPDQRPPLPSAFGSALFYPSHDIACLWSIYYMTLIIAIRSHPHMHPAAHVAAALCASETSFFANEIGRIAAGITPPPPNHHNLPLDPILGASLCESCMPSFFAAVQYQNTPSRHETVLRIFEIGQRTGWGTAELIANGCETAWVKSAAAGRGPPYERILRARAEASEDPRLNGRWERVDPDSLPDVRDESDRRLVKVNKPSARLNWAIGIMGTEEDEKMVDAV